MIGERVVSLERFSAIHARIGSLKSYVEQKFRELGSSLYRVQREVIILGTLLSLKTVPLQ